MSRQIGLPQMAMSVLALAVLSCPLQAAEPTAATERVLTDARDRIDAATSYTVRQKEAFQRKAQAELAALQKDIKALRSRVHEASEATRADLQAAIDDVDKKKERAKHKMEELRSATDAKWGDVKSAASRALDETRKAYQKTASYLR